MKLILILIFFLTCNIYPQDAKELYKYILSPEILNNRTILENSISTILQEVKLNPELIYYRIKFLNEFIGKKNRDTLTNGFNELQNAQTKFKLERNDWLLKQINSIKVDTKYYSMVKDFFEDALIDNKKKEFKLKDKIDQNLMDFYVCFFYTKGQINKYDNKVNYTLLRIQNEKQIIDNIILTSKIIASEQDISEYNLFDLIIENIYLLDKYETLDYVEILVTQLIKEYDINNIMKFSLGTYFMTKFNTVNNSITLSPSLGNGKYKMGTVKYLEQFGMDFSYKLFIKSDIAIFSYIDFSLYYTLIKVSNTVNESPTYYRNDPPFIGNSKLYDFYDFKELKYSNVFSNKIGFGIMTPIFVINPNLIIDVGVFVSYQNTDYEIETLYDYRRIQSYYHDTGLFNYSIELESKSGNREIYKSDNKIIEIAPAVSIHLYNIFDRIELRLFNGVNLVSAGIRTAF